MPDTPTDAPSPEPRKRPRLRERLRLPEVSGKWTVLWLLLCFILTGVLIPLVLKLPKWVEFEIVVACWWVLWAIVLTKLLYAGEQVSDDHRHHKPRDWFGLKKSEGSSGNWGDLSGCGSADGEGCLVLLGLIAALILVWFLIEIAIPVVFLMLYFLVRGMLVSVVNDRPGCRGNFSFSAARGALWATVYTLPLALTIWLIHFIHMKHGH
jgi:hypothetical protein